MEHRDWGSCLGIIGTGEHRDWGTSLGNIGGGNFCGMEVGDIGTGEVSLENIGTGEHRDW